MDHKPLISEDSDFEIGFDHFQVPVDVDALNTLDSSFLYTQYIVHETLNSAGYLHKNETLSKTGIIMGSRESSAEEIFNLFSPAYYDELETNIQELISEPRFQFDTSIIPSSGSPLNIFNFSYPTMLAARTFDLKGPAFSFDGACASSLYSIRLAGEYLEAGLADMMVAGGLFFGLRNKALPAFFESLDITAKPGSCKPLDKTSGGMIPNEGGGAILLKRLEHALADGDTIHAVIDSVGWSNSGRGKQILAPSNSGQMMAYQDAYNELDIDNGTKPIPATEIDYIECHATGTSVGDSVELDSLEAYYKPIYDKNQIARGPLFGAAKGNIGHLLTASGMASVIKIILSMKLGSIPATYGITNPMESSNGFFSGANMVKENTPWPSNDNPDKLKRAAISAFGFGGSNAHLILSEHDTHNSPQPNSSASQPKQEAVAVVGLGAQVGSLNNVKEVSDALYYGKTPTGRSHTKRLRGIDESESIKNWLAAKNTFKANYYFPQFEFDFIKNSVLPREECEAVNKELILLKTVSQALVDAGFSRNERKNVAVIVAAKQNLFHLQLGLHVYLTDLIEGSLKSSGITLSDEKRNKLTQITQDAVMSPNAGFDLLAACIGPIIANRISSVWDFTGPSIKLCSLEHSFSQSLDLAQRLLQKQQLDGVVVASIDGDPVLESRIWHEKYGKHYDLSSEGCTYGESAIALVLKSQAQAQSSKNYVYAQLDCAQQRRKGLNEVKPQEFDSFYQSGLMQQGLKPQDIDYLELSGDLCRVSVKSPLQQLNALFSDKNIKTGDACFNLGQSFHTSEAHSVLKSILMLDGSFKPRTLKKPGGPALNWEHENLELSSTSSYWLDRINEKHISVINTGFNGSFSHTLISRTHHQDQQAAPSRSVFHKDDYFFLLSANQLTSLNEALNQLLDQFSGKTDLTQLKYDLYTKLDLEAPYTAVIMGESLGELISETELLLSALATHAEPDLEWKGNRGSYFTSHPMAKNGEVCLCYPPSGLSAPFSVYEMVSTVPEINQFLGEKLQELPVEIQQLLAEIDKHQKSKKELPIYMDGLVGALTSELVLNIIGLQPSAFIGLSFGELVMNSVTEVYSEEEGANFILDLVAPYINRLSDPEFLKKYYDDPDVEWTTYYCNGNKDRIAQFLQHIENNDSVYLSIYASPTNLVISGLRPQCEAATSKFNLLAYPISHNIFVHTPPAMEFFDEIIETNLKHPYWINEPKPARYYKTYDCGVFNYDKQEFAENVASCICRPIDFKKVLEKAHGDGVRLFVGMDGADLCETWIKDNLEQKPNVALSLKQRELNFKQSIYSFCAKLISQGIKLNLPRILGFQASDMALFEAKENNTAKKLPSLIKTVNNEPATYRDVMLTEANRLLFKATKPDKVKGSKANEPAPKPTATASTTIQPVIPPVGEKSLTVTTPAQVKPATAVGVTTSTLLTAQPQSIRSKDLMTLLKRNHDNNVAIHQQYLTTQMKYADMLVNNLSSLQNNGPVTNVTSPITSTPKPATIFAVPNPAAPMTSGAQTGKKAPLWDRQTLEELTLGKLSNIWGERYKEVDHYPIRARLPAPPFMFVSRVTRVEAEYQQLKPSLIETEYDIPHDAWYLCNGRVPVSVATESSHSGILLLSYIGVDAMFGGRLRFRAIDSTFIAHNQNLLCAGETCRGVFKLDKAIQNQNAVLAFYTYDLYDSNDTHLFTIKGLGGLFSREELDKAQQAKNRLPKNPTPSTQTNLDWSKPILTTGKTSFSFEDLDYIQNGRTDLCFGEHYPRFNKQQQLYPPQFRVLSRVAHLDTKGGAHGLGHIVGEADIDPNLWVFDAHFPNDPVLPATYSVEGMVQLFVFYFHATGLVTLASDTAERSVCTDITASLSFRGEVQRKPMTLRYELTITDIIVGDTLAVTGDVLIYQEEKLLTVVQNMGITMAPPTESQ